MFWCVASDVTLHQRVCVQVVGGCDDRMTTLAKSYGLPSECIVTVAQLIDVVPHIVVERKRSAAQQETFDRVWKKKKMSFLLSVSRS